ncbi:MAG: hypothetical protein OXC62_08210 [Aestuariivita sp.]|nr:hypothetical protein [Aestuariivita sp.]
MDQNDANRRSALLSLPESLARRVLQSRANALQCLVDFLPVIEAKRVVPANWGELEEKVAALRSKLDSEVIDSWLVLNAFHCPRLSDTPYKALGELLDALNDAVDFRIWELENPSAPPSRAVMRLLGFPAVLRPGEPDAPATRYRFVQTEGKHKERLAVPHY